MNKQNISNSSMLNLNRNYYKIIIMNTFRKTRTNINNLTIMQFLLQNIMNSNILKSMLNILTLIAKIRICMFMTKSSNYSTKTTKNTLLIMRYKKVKCKFKNTKSMTRKPNICMKTPTISTPTTSFQQWNPHKATTTMRLSPRSQ